MAHVCRKIVCVICSVGALSSILPYLVSPKFEQQVFFVEPSERESQAWQRFRPPSPYVVALIEVVTTILAIRSKVKKGMRSTAA